MTKSTETKRTPEEKAYRRKMIKKFIQLYFVQTKKYLIMHKSGTYSTYTEGKDTKSGKKVKSLADWQLFNHLDGQHTVGACSGMFMNKFLAFDVDFPDIKNAKWIVYKISDTLDEMKIDHHISYSGSKGYHIEIFFEDLLPHNVHRNLYDYVLDQADVRQYINSSNRGGVKKLGNGSEIELGNVEHRPNESYGIKLPLGYHQKTEKFCGYCDKYDGLRVMSPAESYEYLLSIKQINCASLVEEYFPELMDYSKVDQFVTREDLLSTENAIAKYNPPKYQVSEKEAIDEAVDLLENGLKYKNSRHNSIFKIAKLFKYYGVEEEETVQELMIWMERQSKDFYTTSLEESFSDIVKTVQDVYAGLYSIKPPERNIAVTYPEIIAIINSCPSETEKLLMYAILIHSKRYATKKGVFYFIQEKMSEVTGLSLSAVKRTLPKLERSEVLEYVKRNLKFDKETGKRPKNEYRVLLKVDAGIDGAKEYITDRQDDLNNCLISLLTLDEINKLPRRHKEKLKYSCIA
ncbi:TOTE conflict system archaeo-eukaryotic primase domain-containing protein [Paenibacillus silvisoli]|uniref:TOTE conflict system archaeo-eukaryotic primase domain-containing protein n=1 Tax=Paenibacillus silvisoli TaxID=3110539 RepID=UPI00280577B4|nr:hypothetical protein [Paenibacillus silvisoli]